MTDTTLIERCAPALRPGLPARIARKAVHARLSRLTHGRLRLRDGGETHAFGNGDGIESSITVLDPAFYADVALGGSVGAGESYVQGRWRSDDLTGAMRLMLQNGDALGGMERGLARLSAPLHRLAHALRRNTRAGSRRNISAHYDVGNDFFRLMLDETMMYSCALFERPDMSLAEAQVAKLDRLCRTLDLGPSDHVLEIGTGWGGFAIHAAGRYGCRVTTTTISPAQFELARERVARAGLADRVTLLARGLSRPARPLRQARIDRDDRGHRPPAVSASTSTRRRPCCRAAAGWRSSRSRSRTGITSARATRSISSSATSSRAPASRP